MMRRYDVNCGVPSSVTARITCATPSPLHGIKPGSHGARQTAVATTVAFGLSEPSTFTSERFVSAPPAWGQREGSGIEPRIKIGSIRVGIANYVHALSVTTAGHVSTDATQACQHRRSTARAMQRIEQAIESTRVNPWCFLSRSGGHVRSVMGRGGRDSRRPRTK